MEIVNLSASKSHEKFSQIIFKYEWALKKKIRQNKKKDTGNILLLEICLQFVFEIKLGYTVLHNNQVRSLMRR